MNKQDLAGLVRQLRENETLSYVINSIQQDAANDFMNPSSNEERILKAHGSVKAVGILMSAFDAIEADAKMENRES